MEIGRYDDGNFTEVFNDTTRWQVQVPGKGAAPAKAKAARHCSSLLSALSGAGSDGGLSKRPKHGQGSGSIVRQSSSPTKGSSSKRSSSFAAPSLDGQLDAAQDGDDNETIMTLDEDDKAKLNRQRKSLMPCMPRLSCHACLVSYASHALSFAPCIL